MTSTEFQTTLAQTPSYVLVVEVSKPFDSLPFSKDLVGQKFVIMSPESESGNNPYVVIHRLDETLKKLDQYSTQYPIKGIKFLGYARLFNESLDPGMYKNLSLGDVQEQADQLPKTAYDDLANLRESVTKQIQATLKRVQSGAYGAPTLSDLEKCGELHSILEQL